MKNLRWSVQRKVVACFLNEEFICFSYRFNNNHHAAVKPRAYNKEAFLGEKPEKSLSVIKKRKLTSSPALSFSRMSVCSFKAST